jgi:integrase
MNLTIEHFDGAVRLCRTYAGLTPQEALLRFYQDVLGADRQIRRRGANSWAVIGLRAELRGKGVPEEALPSGLPRIRFHDLRHAHATLLLQQGVHPRVMQERLGRSTISMISDIYIIVMCFQGCKHRPRRLCRSGCLVQGRMPQCRRHRGDYEGR